MRYRLSKLEKLKIVYSLYFKKGVIFITGNTGSGKTNLMLDIIKYSINKKFVCYGPDGTGIDDKGEYERNIDSKYNHQFNTNKLREKTPFFQIKSQIHEELSHGFDIVFDDAEIFITEESLPVLKSLFDTGLKSRVFFICQTNREKQKQHRLPLSNIGGIELKL